MPTKRTTVRRLPERGAYDRATIDAILDATCIASVGIVEDGTPLVLPMVFARDGDRLLLHGSPGSRLQRVLRGSAEVCVAVTLIDGLVLARSAAHHSVNFRSVLVLGRGVELEGADKQRAFERIVEHAVPGRWADCRQPNAHETKTTQVIAIPLTEASAKLRTGPPKDDEEDYALPHWAGVLPLTQAVGGPVPDPRSHPETELPAYLMRYVERSGGR